MALPIVDPARLLAFLRCPRRAYLDAAGPGRSIRSLDRHRAALRRQVLHAAAAVPAERLVGGPSAAGPEDRGAPLERRWRPRFRARTATARLWADVDVALGGDAGLVLIVVASGTRVRPHHRLRLAWAWHVAARARLADGGRTPPVIGARVAHLDPAGGGPPWSFASRDVTAELAPERAPLPRLADALAGVLAATTTPEATLGRACQRPEPCRYRPRCWAGVSGPTVFDVPGLHGDTREALARSGALRLASVPADDGCLDPRERAALQLVRDRRVEVERPLLRRALAEVGAPAAYLDLEFETSALAPWPDVRPFEAVPFAFDVLTPGADGARHVTYLAPVGPDPRPALAAALAVALPSQGRIVTYDMGAERALLLALAHHAPAAREALRSAAERLWDLLPLVRRGVRHHAFGGALALDRVADALAPGRPRDPLGGADAELVRDGLGAQVAWRRLRAPGGAGRPALRRAVAAYVARDTAAMAAIVAWLRDRARTPDPGSDGDRPSRAREG